MAQSTTPPTPDGMDIDHDDTTVEVDADHLTETIQHLRIIQRANGTSGDEDLQRELAELANYHLIQLARARDTFEWSEVTRRYIGKYQPAADAVVVAGDDGTMLEHGQTVKVVLDGHLGNIYVEAVADENAVMQEVAPDVDWGHPDCVVAKAELDHPLETPPKAGDPAILLNLRPADVDLIETPAN